MSLQVAALYQLGSLTYHLGTVTTSLLMDSSLKLLDTVFSGLLSPWLPVRLASSQCLRHVSSAVRVRVTLNGISHTQGKVLFNCGEELLRYASPSSRLRRDRTKAGYLFIGNLSLKSRVILF